MRRVSIIMMILAGIFLFSQNAQGLKPGYLLATEFHYTYSKKYEAAAMLQGAEKLNKFRELYDEIKAWLKKQSFPRATLDVCTGLC